MKVRTVCLACRQAPSCCVHKAEGESELLDQGFTLMTSFSLNYVKALSLDIVTLEIGASTCEFGRTQTFIPSICLHRKKSRTLVVCIIIHTYTSRKRIDH